MKNIGIALGLSIALGLGSAVARADEPAGPPAPAAEEKPLVLRETKSAEAPAASAPSTTMTLLKGLGVAGIAVAGFMVLKRRKMQGGGRASGVDVKIVGRTALGMRTEVCVVDVGGERLVLGVTPTTVTTLSILQDAPVELGELAVTEPREHTTVRTRARSLAEEPESALLRLLDNARKQTANLPAPSRHISDVPPSARRADETPTTRHDLSSPTTRHDLDAEATVAIPPKPPAAPRQRAPRRLEEQVRGLNVAKSRRAS